MSLVKQCVSIFLFRVEFAGRYYHHCHYSSLYIRSTGGHKSMLSLQGLNFYHQCRPGFLVDILKVHKVAMDRPYQPNN